MSWLRVHAVLLPLLSQDYLEVFRNFTLTVCGLGMDSKRLHTPSSVVLAPEEGGWVQETHVSS